MGPPVGCPPWLKMFKDESNHSWFLQRSKICTHIYTHTYKQKYIHICTYTQTYVHTCMYAYTYACVWTCIFICLYACVHVYLYTYRYVFVCVYVRACKCVERICSKVCNAIACVGWNHNPPAEGRSILSLRNRKAARTNKTEQTRQNKQDKKDEQKIASTVMPNTCITPVAHINESCRTYERGTAESRRYQHHDQPRVMSLIWMSHVAHIWTQERHGDDFFFSKIHGGEDP